MRTTLCSALSKKTCNEMQSVVLNLASCEGYGAATIMEP